MHFLSKTSGGLQSVFISLAVLLLLIGAMWALLSVVRRKMQAEEHTPRDFSLTDLRALHREGKLTDEEFERAKSLMVTKVHSKLAKEVKPSMVAEPLNADLKNELPPNRNE